MTVYLSKEGNIINILISILCAILVFGVIIFVHELGHFITAKLVKIQVNEFALGMGPVLLKKQGKETLYSLRLFPIGGFCAMEGEDGDGGEQNERAFNNKAKWKRALVLIAGAFMNLLLGFLIIAGLFWSKPLFATNQIVRFADDAKSNVTGDNGGLQVEDRVLAINGWKVNIDSDIMFSLIRIKDGKADIEVLRDGEKLLLKNIEFPTIEDENGNVSMITDFKVLGKDNALSHPFDTKGKSVLAHIGDLFMSFGTLLSQAVLWIVSLVKFVWVSVIDLITGNFSLNQMAGPIGTTGAIGQAAQAGLSNLLMIVVFITVNLGVVNLLPFPALDGGRLLLLGIEAVRRKPMNPKYEGMLNLVGFALLMILMVVVAFNDIVRIFRT